jgi:hypothetical protein
MEGGRRLPVMLQNLEVGAKVKLKGDITAEVTGNPKDGSWVYVRYLSHPKDPAQVGAEELAFADDVVEELKA